MKIRLAWTGTDKGYGVSKFELWQSVNGHSYTKVTTTSGHSAYVTATVGKNYRFRVRAIDKKNNIGSYVYGPKFTVYLAQETSGAIVYSSPWSTLNSSVYSGGHVRSTTTAGFDATFTTVARTITWVAAKGPARGTADVYVDGVLKAHINLNSSSALYKYVAYSFTFPTSIAHSMRSCTRARSRGGSTWTRSSSCADAPTSRSRPGPGHRSGPGLRSCPVRGRMRGGARDQGPRGPNRPVRGTSRPPATS